MLTATRFLGAAIAAFMLWVMAGPGSARADVPIYNGDMSFPVIQDTSGPEDFSWKVQLGVGQGLEQLDEQTAAIYYVSDHSTALTISAEAAHDATGASVPTTLGVSEGDILTLTVHHLAGNPKAGGAPFDYPVMGGPGWEGGFQPVIIQMPPTEAELREQREREAREALSGGHCVVPSLKGKSLRASRRRLARSGCRLGRVTRKVSASAKSAKVVVQNPRTGAVLRPGSSVSVKLG